MNIRRTILINSEAQNLKRKEKVIEDENFLRPVFADRNSESKKVKDFFSLFFFSRIISSRKMTRYLEAGRMFLVGWRSVVSGF